MSRTTTPTATLDGVSVRYGSLLALDRTTTTFDAASSVALVGANGSGKSTLLLLLAGLLAPTTGEVSRSDEVAFIGQQHAHHTWLPISVDEVLQMGCYRRRGLLGRITARDRRELSDVADRLEVADLRRRSFGELSGGQRQRVLVAQALLGSPTMLLLDEPITGLDIPSQETILRIVAEEVARGATVVFSTHHLDEARRADRVILLAGCVIADGTPHDVLRPEHLAVAFGDRVIAVDDSTVLVDDHGHGHGHDHGLGHAHGDHEHHDDLGHRHLHEAEHADHVDPGAAPPMT